MKKDCKLITTLPKTIGNGKRIIEDMFQNELVDSVRLNTGVNELINNRELLTYLKELSDRFNRTLWLDIKGRQLRINAWADISYECIELNHDIKIEYPAYIEFRNGNKSEICRAIGNKILVYSPPKEAVGKGQSINIHAESLNINGYLTQKDIEILKLSHELNINTIMASYVEEMNDLIDILKINPNAKIVSKIESKKGIEFINQYDNLSLMAARDDLYIETGSNLSMLKHLKNIIEKDKNAICASRIFESLNKKDTVSLQDYIDLEYMYSLGYKTFMLGDSVSNYEYTKALKAWKEFTNE